MTRKKRTRILIEGSSDLSEKLAQQIIESYKVQLIEESNHGLVMIKAREKAKQSLFYLGEVLITEAKVMINGSLGIGMVKGHEPELAYNLAIIDAAYNANLSETSSWTQVLLLEQESIQRQAEDYKNKILRTKVNFNTMTT